MMLQTDPPASEPEATQDNIPSTEYMEVPIDRIETGVQVRTGIDPAGESILALVESIRERGVIQSLTVCPSGDGYFLVVGERRLLAARAAGLSTVPVRVIPTVQQREDSLSLQLVENLQREDLNPMDMTDGIYALVQSRHGDVSVDALINLFILAERSPERVPPEFVGSLPTIVKLSGKSLNHSKGC